MILDEFLIALGVKADTKKLQDFEKGLDGVSDSAEKTEVSMLKAYDATDTFVSEVGKAMGIITFFTGVLGGALGVFHGTIMGLQELIDEEKLLTKVTKDQIDQQKKYKESVETMGKRFQSLKVELAFGFLPTMQKTIDSLDNFLKANKDAIINGITVFLNAIKSTLSVIGNFIRFIDKLVTNTVGWRNALLILVGVLAIVKKATIAAFIANPITWVVAAIAGLLLLIDDFMTYLDGGESQFGAFWGSMLKWIEENQNGLNLIKDIFMGLVNFVVGALALLVGVFTGNTNLIKVVWDDAIESMIGVWYFFGNAIDDVLETISNYFKEKFDEISNYVGGIVSGIVNYFKGMINAISTVSSVIYTAVTTPFRLAFDWITSQFAKIPNMIKNVTSTLTFGLSDKIGSAVSNIRNSVVNNSSNTNAVINVNGNANPIATGNAVAGKLNKTTQMNFGGMAKA